MSDTASRSSNFCYRHPDRQSYILCQRCGRTICPACQTQAAVGVQCPDCVKEGRASTPRRKPAIVTAFRRGSSQPVVTYSIIALCAVLFVLQNLPGIGGIINVYGVYRPIFTEIVPWTMLTAIFLHGSIFHILVNMYSLFIFGSVMERLLGRWRFLALFLVSGFGGSVAVLWLAPGSAVVGASGAIFGLLGAFFVIQRRLGGNNIQLLIVIAINLVIGFLPGLNISWQAHVGGLVAGAAVAFVFLRTRRQDQARMQGLLVAGVVAALLVLTVVGVARLGQG